MINDALFQILTNDAQPMAATAPDERRDQPRMMTSLRAECVFDFGQVYERSVTVVIRELSRAGVSFLTSERLRAGQEFMIKLMDGNSRPVFLHGAIVHCQPDAGGGKLNNVGAVFTRVDHPAATEQITERIRAAILG